MSTAVGMFVVGLLRLLLAVFPVAAGGIHPFGRMADLFLFLALVTGFLCLAFTLLIHRVRETAPPRPITTAAVLIGFAPLVMVLVLGALHWR